jgi:hypothetical protein
VHNVSVVRQIEILVHTTESLVHGISHRHIEIAIAKFERSPGGDQIPAELIQAGSETLLSAVHKLINCLE